MKREDELKKLRELMRKGREKLKKQNSSKSNDTFNDSDIIWPSKRVKINSKKNHKKYFPDIIFVEKKLDDNNEEITHSIIINKNNNKKKVNQIDNYLDIFLNNNYNEYDKINNEKEEEENYDKNRYLIDLEKNLNDNNNSNDENLNEENTINTINGSTFESNNYDIEVDKLEIPKNIIIENKNNKPKKNIHEYESDFGKIEELKIELEKDLGADLFFDIYHIVDESTDLDEVKFDEDKVKKKIKNQWINKKKYNANEIDNAIQKIPEVFSIISQERISTFC